MRALIQRVHRAQVSVDQEIKAHIDRGLLIFLGITSGDNEKDIHYLIDKITNLRIFEGESGKLDLSVRDVSGKLLVVSQFTLYAQCDKGRRPDFALSAKTDEAKVIYEKAVMLFLQCGIPVEFGQFQANMQVELVNDGPFTLILESKK